MSESNEKLSAKLVAPKFQKKNGVLCRELGKDEQPISGMAAIILRLEQKYPNTIEMRVEATHPTKEDCQKNVTIEFDYMQVQKKLEDVTGKPRKWNTIWKGFKRQGFSMVRDLSPEKRKTRKFFINFAGYMENVANKEKTNTRKIRVKKRYNSIGCSKKHYDTRGSKIITRSFTSKSTQTTTKKRPRVVKEQEEYIEHSDEEEFVLKTQDLREIFARKTRHNKRQKQQTVTAAVNLKLAKKESKKKTKKKRKVVEQHRENRSEEYENSTIEDNYTSCLNELETLAKKLFKNEFIDIVVNLKPRRRKNSPRKPVKRVKIELKVDKDYETFFNEEEDEEGEEEEVNDNFLTTTKHVQRSLFSSTTRDVQEFTDFDDPLYREVLAMSPYSGPVSMYEAQHSLWSVANYNFDDNSIFCE